MCSLLLLAGHLADLRPLQRLALTTRLRPCLKDENYFKFLSAANMTIGLVSRSNPSKVTARVLLSVQEKEVGCGRNKSP